MLYANPAWADDDPHSPHDRTVPVPETFEPGEADTDPAGGDPPDQAWEPDGSQEESERSPGWTCSTGEENLGIADWHPMQRHQISDRLDVDINLENGNAVIRHRDLTVAGTGLDLDLNSVYNSRDLNTKWKQSHGRDIGLKFESDRIAFHGPTGSCDEFMASDDGGYDSPPGLNATLTELDNGHYALTYTRGEFEDQVWYFDANGWAITHADRNGNTNDLRYSNGGDLVAITDTQGRVTSFTEPYGEDGATYSFDHGDGDGTSTTVTDPGGGESIHEFDDQGRQTEATDQVGNTRSQEWTANSDIASTTDALEASVSYDYDDAINLIGTELPTGAETSVASMAATGLVGGSVAGLAGGPVGGLTAGAIGFYGGILANAAVGGINCRLKSGRNRTGRPPRKRLRDFRRGASFSPFSIWLCVQVPPG